jgi:hypothetical protein
MAKTSAGHELVYQGKAALLNTIGKPAVDKICDEGFELTKKKLTKDPYMCECVKRIVARALDILKPEVKQELYESFCSAVREPQPVDHGMPPSCRCSMRAFVLYHYYPYNRTGWYKMTRDPVWWIFTVLACTQFFCVRAIWFTLLFLLMDRSDEYQLLNLIITFKGTQVFSGIFAGLLGAANFFRCVGLVRRKTPALEGDIRDVETLSEKTVQSDSCASYGPGVSETWYFSVVTLAIHGTICWVSFLLLRCSKKKGKVLMLTEKKMEEGDESDPCCGDPKKMGVMRWLLIYDISSLAFCVGLLVAAFSAQNLQPTDFDNWLFQLDLYWIKVLYLLLAFPFLFLKLPFAPVVLFHARPTGYNPYGNCVPVTEEDFSSNSHKSRRVHNIEDLGP